MAWRLTVPALFTLLTFLRLIDSDVPPTVMPETNDNDVKVKPSRFNRIDPNSLNFDVYSYHRLGLVSKRYKSTAVIGKRFPDET